MPKPDDIFISEMEKLGVKFVDETPKDKEPSESWEKEFDRVLGWRFNIGVVPDDTTKEIVKHFIRQQRKQEAEEAIKAVTPGECPLEQDDDLFLETGWNACRAEVIRKGQEHLKTL